MRSKKQRIVIGRIGTADRLRLASQRVDDRFESGRQAGWKEGAQWGLARAQVLATSGHRAGSGGAGVPVPTEITTDPVVKHQLVALRQTLEDKQPDVLSLRTWIAGLSGLGLGLIIALVLYLVTQDE